MSRTLSGSMIMTPCVGANNKGQTPKESGIVLRENPLLENSREADK